MSAPPPGLAAARAGVLATLSAGGPPPTDPVVARAPGVLRPVSAQLSAKLARRVRAGLPPTGVAPSRPRLAKLVRPSAGLAVVDAVLLGFCVAQGRTTLAIAAAVLLAAFAALAIVGTLATARDPLRITAAERTALAAAATWQSPPAEVVGAPAHRLVALAAAEAERIAASQAWLDTRIDLLPVDLAAVLDEVVASTLDSTSGSGSAGSGSSGSADGEPPGAAVDLVAMIVAYADLLGEPLDQAAREQLAALADQLRAQTMRAAPRFGEP